MAFRKFLAGTIESDDFPKVPRSSQRKRTNIGLPEGFSLKPEKASTA
ncbi:hypothetical protein A2U01_0103471 [Trifolium medium]|uniref:Uncharacterized protein n=1 Tax=Trifolium medium TaxID=97028 RepID=A0A392V252_9FABA|nr:hypothetical protein [Trifolium medium]